MARFNLNEYATVAERIQTVYSLYPDARIITENLTTAADREARTWVFKATLFLTSEDQLAYLPKSTGHAFEIDGTGGANATSAMENAESSAVGRCLAIAGWSGNKNQTALASREEMVKVAAGAPIRDWLAESETILSYDAMKTLWANASAANASAEVLAEIAARGTKLKSESVG